MTFLGPNAGLIGQPGSRARLCTPALVLDLAALERNIAAMAAYCDRHGVALRPHAKTHKSVEVARRQLEAGAVGISVATIGEAERLTDLDQKFQLWRFHHLKTVERVISYKPGTGGTGGVSYLAKALELKFFPELWHARTSM